MNYLFKIIFDEQEKQNETICGVSYDTPFTLSVESSNTYNIHIITELF